MSISSQNPKGIVSKKDNHYSLSLLGDAIRIESHHIDSTHINVLRDEFRKTLSQVTVVDDLTNLYNRRYFDKAFTEIWYNQQDSKECLSLILCDIDFLKSYNNMYGYQLGDQILKCVAQKLSEQLQTVPNSIIARYSADCFAMLLPNSLIDEAMVQTEAMLMAVENLAIPNAASNVADVVTASFGIASTYPRPNLIKKDFFESAKIALDEAKAQGRNAAYTLPPAWSQDSLNSLTN